MSAEMFTPLQEVDTTRIRANLTLPYHMEEKVGLNIKATKTLCQIGGVRSLWIQNDHDQTAPNIVGVTKDGNALAGLGRTTHISKNTHTPSDEYLPSARWSLLQVARNEQECVSKLEQEKKDLKDPENWAKIVDNSIKDGINSAAINNLVKRPLPLKMAIFTSIAYLSMASIPIITHSFLSTLPSYAQWKVVSLFSSVLVNDADMEYSGGGKRWSLSIYEFPELDRMLALSLVSPFKKLAKEITAATS